MKAGILITARLGSTRLKKKHILPVTRRPIIQYLIDRIRWEFRDEITKGHIELIIATSDEQENKEFEAKLNNIVVFYGSKNNIPLRHYEAAKTYDLDSVISVDGDDILCSPKGMRKVYEALKNGASYTKTSGLPFGMNSSGYKVSFLAKSLQGCSKSVLETGWGRIFCEDELKEIGFSFPNDNIGLRFTLDYEEDYQFFKAVIETCGEKIIRMKDEEIVEVVIKNELFKINEAVSKKYWDNFSQTREQEIIKNIETEGVNQ